jgi:hypothetical protein
MTQPFPQKVVNAYMRYSMAKLALRRQKRVLDAAIAKAIKHIERLPEDAAEERAKWLKISEDGIAMIARLEHEVQAQEREIAIREGRA